MIPDATDSAKLPHGSRVSMFPQRNKCALSNCRRAPVALWASGTVPMTCLLIMAAVVLSSGLAAGTTLTAGAAMSMTPAAHHSTMCRKAFVSASRSVTTGTDYIPFLGTSVISDQQLYMLRLLHSIDYPVKNLVIVVQDPAIHNNNIIRAELEHAQQFLHNIVLVYCDTQPSVTESWNLVFQSFPGEPWGMYAARDVQFKPGALELFAKHVWRDMDAGSMDMAFINWWVPFRSRSTLCCLLHD